jgi:hypothetical protein
MAGTYIRICPEVKSWIRIHIETNADSQHWVLGNINLPNGVLELKIKKSQPQIPNSSLCMEWERGHLKSS